jgi:maltose O-acetyltransferase
MPATKARKYIFVSSQRLNDYRLVSVRAQRLVSDVEGGPGGRTDFDSFLINPPIVAAKVLLYMSERFYRERWLSTHETWQLRHIRVRSPNETPRMRRTNDVYGNEPVLPLPQQCPDAQCRTRPQTPNAKDRTQPAPASLSIFARVQIGIMKTEKEKMLAGELYDPLDRQLADARRRARLLFKALNDTRDDQVEERSRLVRELIPSAGAGVWIEPPFYCDYGSNILLGEKVFFNFNCVILDVAQVRIGSGVMFGPAVQIYTATHPLSADERKTGLELGKAIEIGNDVWIGGGAILCPGIRIGNRSVIGAGSVVTRDIPDAVLAAGNPCAVIRNIDE